MSRAERAGATHGAFTSEVPKRVGERADSGNGDSPGWGT